jgi:HK97 family phage portal protein
MLHIRYRTLDGYRGISPISYAREPIGLALATEKHGARLFKNGARPGGILEHPNKMSEDAAKRFKESWQAAFTGDNVHKTALLEDGMKFNPLTMTSEDAQYLETRRFQTAEIARIFRVPLHMIQETEKATSWGSGIESMSTGFVRDTLTPWLTRWEQALMRDLLTEDEKRSMYIKHVVAGMVRGDMKTRFASYNVAIMSGIMSPNEARALEEMDKREGGDEYLSPMNMRLGTDGNTDSNTDGAGSGQGGTK